MNSDIASRKYPQVDITSVVIQKGDYLIVQTPNLLSHFKVTEVEGTDVKRKRKITLEVVASTDERKHTTKELVLIPGVETLGCVVSGDKFDPDVYFDTKSDYDHNSAILAELKMLLLKQKHRGYKMPFKTVVEHMQRLGLLPSEPLNIDKKKRRRLESYKTLSTLLSYAGDTFFSDRGVIELLQNNGKGQGGVQIDTARYVNQRKLFEGINMLIESGIFGHVVFVDDEE